MLLRCIVCDAELRREARFCDSCGAPVEPAAAPVPAESNPEARKSVTIVFADQIGSTPLQERMDAESVRHVMGRFYEVMSEVIEGHGGRVVKFVGDAVQGVWGIPLVQEDDAEHGVRAAFAMVEALSSLNEEIERTWGVRIGLRTGVNTGEVVESTEGFVVGDCVNVAARLEQVASDGEILVGEDTWRLVRDKVTLEHVPDLKLKGKSEPVAIYRLLSLDPPDAAPRAPFVGREGELSKLYDAFARTIDERCARLATVIGSPGVGKTRLAGELASRVGDSAMVLEARCEPAGTSTFAPIADALRAAASIDEAASDDEVVQALTDVLPTDHPDRQRIASRAATVLGAGEPGPPEETFWAVRRIFEALARERPLVLVIDDVHWAEPMLLDLIEHLADWTRDAPMLLLALARPDLHESRPSLTEPGQRDAVIVLLEGLDPGASVRLASDLLDADELPAALTERILASSEGNPLFLRELVRMLVDDGVLRKDDGSWVVTVDATDVDVPPTIHALLSARIDRLPADERVVVERASVIGKQFYRGAVAALAPAPVAAALDQHLETLRRKQLVEPEGTYWIDEPVFRFHHVLIRDAAYRRLLKEARADLHERFAEWLERKAGELVGEHEEVIGYHLEQAHEYRQQLGLLDARGVELGRRAAKHLAAAGRRAIDRDDLAAAAPLLGRALERLEEPDAEILIDRCEALLELGDIAEGTVAIEQLALIADTPRLQAWADCYAGQLANLVDPGHLHETAELVANAAARFAEIGDLDGAAKAHHVHALTLGRLGQFGASEAALDRALAAARDTGDNRRSNSVLSGIPVAVLWGPHPVAKATGRCLDVIRVLRITTASPAVESAALRCQAVLEALRGRADAARRMLETSRATLEELGLRHGLLETDMFAGIVEIYASEPAAAEEKLRRAYEGFRSLGVDVDAAYCAALIARTLMSQGRNEEAEALTHESERLGGDDLKTGILWRAIRGAALAARGEVDEPLRLAREAVALAESTDASVDHADACRALGVALGRVGRDAEGQAEIARAIELYESKGATAAAEHARTRGTALTPLTASPGDRTGGVHARPGGDATHIDFLERLRAAFVQQDWDAMFTRMFDPDVVVTDERSGLRSEVVGREAFAAGIRTTYAGREADARLEVIASRNRTLLMRSLFFGPGDATGGPWESDRLWVLGLRADDDRIVRGRFIDPDQLDAAMELFEEWAGQPNGDVGDARAGWLRVAPGVDTTHVDYVGRLRSAFVGQDWDGAFTSAFDPDVVIIDERSGLRSEVVGRDPWVQGIRTTYDGRPTDVQWEIVASRGRAFVLRMLFFGAGDAAGGPWESDRLMVLALDPHDDVITRGHYVDPDRLDAAMAIFEEWAGARTGAVRAAHGTDQRLVRLWTHFRELMVAQDWEAFAGIWHRESVYRDHRPGLKSEIVGGEGAARIIAESFGQRGFDYDIEIIASRGGAVVFRSRFFGSEDEFGGPWEAERLVFGEFDDDDLLVRGELFDPSQLDIVLAMLDEIDPPTDDIEHRHRRWFERLGSAMRTKDWDDLRRIIADDFVYRDHRVGLMSEITDPDEMVRVIRESQGTREGDYSGQVLATHGDAGVAHGRLEGPGDELGGPWEAERIYFYVLHGDRMGRIELFDAEQRDVAEGLLAEYAAVHGTVRAAPGVDPRFVRFWQRCRATLVAKDWEGFEAVMNPDALYADRRPGLSSQTHTSADAVRIIRESFGTRDFDYDVEILASSGHASVHVGKFIGFEDDQGGPWEAERLVFVVLDEQGRFLNYELYEPSDHDAVLERLESYRLGGAGVRSAPGTDERHRSAWERFRAAFVPKDWDAFASLLSEDIVHADLRAGLRSVIEGRDTYVRVMRESFGSRSVDYDIEVVASRGNAGVCHNRMLGTGDELGGPFESDRVVFYALDDADLFVRFELYDENALDAALAKLGVDPRHISFVKRYRDATVAKDWDEVTRLMHPDLVMIDHRPGLRAEYHGPEEYARVLRESYGTRDFDWTPTVLESRGDGCLLLSRWSGPGDELGGPWETERLAPCLMVGDALLLRAEIFNVDEMDAAMAVLEEYGRMPRVSAPEGVDPRHPRWFQRFSDAVADRDWARMGEQITEDFVWNDIRRGIAARLEGRDEAVRVILESYATREPEYGAEVLAVRGDVGVARTKWSGRGDELGGPWETERLNVYIMDGDVMSYLDVMDLDDLDHAYARFDAYVAEREPPVRLLTERFIDAYNGRDWTTLEGVLAHDFVLVDHRPLGWGTSTGFAPFFERLKIGIDAAPDARVFVASWRRETANSALFVMPMRGHVSEGGGDFELDRLVIAVTEGDRLARMELFDLEDEAGAAERYERLTNGS